MKARENPFASCCLHQIPYIPVKMPWREIKGRVESLRYRAAILGPEGSGKTALLFHLQSLLERRGLETVYLQVYKRNNYLWPFKTKNVQTIDPDKIYLIDGVDLLPAISWFYLRLKMRHAKGLIVSSHKNRWLPVLVHCETNINLLNDILSRLLPNPTESVSSLGEKFFRQRKGNLRDVLRDLYEFYSEMGSCSDSFPSV